MINTLNSIKRLMSHRRHVKHIGDDERAKELDQEIKPLARELARQATHSAKQGVTDAVRIALLAVAAILWVGLALILAAQYFPPAAQVDGDLITLEDLNHVDE